MDEQKFKMAVMGINLKLQNCCKLMSFKVKLINYQLGKSDTLASPSNQPAGLLPTPEDRHSRRAILLLNWASRKDYEHG